MKLNTKKDISIQYTDVPVAQTVVQLCEIKNVKNIVICSGSRNAPLTNSFVENPFFITYSIVDKGLLLFLLWESPNKCEHLQQLFVLLAQHY